MEARAIGHASFAGLQIYQCIAPDILTPEVLGRAYGLLAGSIPGAEAN